MKKIVPIAIALITLTSCSKNMKSTLGVTQNMPDEYQVKRNRPLEIPPSYKLNNPEIKQQQAKKQPLTKAEQALLKDLESN